MLHSQKLAAKLLVTPYRKLNEFTELRYEYFHIFVNNLSGDYRIERGLITMEVVKDGNLNTEGYNQVVRYCEEHAFVGM
ncbi:MAG: hypothetical protein R3321_00295 [Nitrososphaeraceae archaeon]|nr:hypothetical protein [Nitrososphaeraceae archaeon]